MCFNCYEVILCFAAFCNFLNYWIWQWIYFHSITNLISFAKSIFGFPHISLVDGCCSYFQVNRCIVSLQLADCVSFGSFCVAIGSFTIHLWYKRVFVCLLLLDFSGYDSNILTLCKSISQTMFAKQNLSRLLKISSFVKNLLFIHTHF